MLAFDHLVIASKQPGVEQKSFTRNYGLLGVEGGNHKLWGTFNELCYFTNDNYVEWLGLLDREKAARSDNPLIQQFKQTFDQGEFGPFQFALRTTCMDEYVKNFNENSIPYQGPFPGERKRPDGSLLKWRMLFPHTNGEENLLLPFLIEWTGKNVPSSEHEINQSRFLRICIGVQNLKTAASLYPSIYQLESQVENHTFSLANGELILKENPPSLRADYTDFSI
ncbi:VOC family protein [Halobacillus sp. A5]|uniref:VOC family protein n=1 Tax=Halobacillus sp. A5 TaxID=2880263 RepID=UPI0020A66C06|nr:VOC family protein [Halobacillus sp. A5]MCP3029262.1 VOC family protein [Halobacillus sp. A5]